MVISPGAFRRDRRGVSTTISYVLAIGITVVLVAVLLVGMTAMMDGQRDRAVDSELRVVGEGIATELTTVDRIAVGAAADDTLAMRVEAPDRLAGQSYRVGLTVDDCTTADACVRIRTSDRSLLVALNNRTEVRSAELAGGTLWIVAEGESVTIQDDPP